MPSERTIYNKKTGESATVDASSAVEACRDHPDVWSAVPVEKSSPEPASLSGSAPGAAKAPSHPVPQPGKPDDLTAIDGIGMAREKSLNDAGVFTYAQLHAVTDPLKPPFDRMGSDAEWKRWREQAGRLANA